MSMHDIDKNSDGRLQPTPNADDKVLNRMAHKTIGTTYKSASQPTNQRIIFDQSEIVTYDKDNNVSSFYGYDPDVAANPILKIAKDGYDAKTGTDDQMIFNSQQNALKIVFTGTTTISGASLNTGGANYASGTQVTVTIPHGLGYAPIILGFVDLGQGYLPLPFTTNFVFGGGGFSLEEVFCSTDATSAFFSHRMYGYNTNVSSNAYTIRYYLLQETAAV